MPFTNKKIKKTLLAIFVTLFAAVGTRAQNNAYDIDDSCYFYLNRCEQYISKPQFQENAKENGFYQYYYYAYEVTKNYFYNHNQRMRSVELVLLMDEKKKVDEQLKAEGGGHI